MPKRKSTEEIDTPSKEISLKDITGIDSDLNIISKVDKESQTETIGLNKDNFYIDETIQCLLLDKLADSLKSNKIISKNSEGDQTDGSIDTVKELAEKLFEEIKGNIENTSRENRNKKTKFIKVLIRIFSLLLKANLTSAKKINKVIKQSVKLFLSIWRGQESDKLPGLETDQEAPEQETNKSQDQKTNNLK